MNKIPIDEDIPLPSRMRFPLQDMNVGDSFAVPIEELAKARMAATNYGHRLGIQFATRKLKEQNVGRVWRVK